MKISSQNLAGIAGVLIISAPIVDSAAAAAALAGTFATRLLDEALGFGITKGLNAAFGAAFGTGAQVVSLSEDAYGRIAEIVEEAVNTGFFNDYKANFKAVVDESKDYNRDENDIDQSIDDAGDVLSKATDSVAEMMLDTVNLKGTVMFMVVSSLKLGFYEELRLLEELEGDSSQADHYEQRYKETATEYLAHMWTLLDLWVARRAEMYDYYWRSAGEWYDGWAYRKDKRKCYTGPAPDNNEVCSDNKWECKCEWYKDCSAIGAGWSCKNYDAVEDNIADKRTTQLTSDRSEVLGENFGDYMQTLADINGVTLCPNGNSISETIRYVSCITKVYGPV